MVSSTSCQRRAAPILTSKLCGKGLIWPGIIVSLRQRVFQLRTISQSLESRVSFVSI